MAKQRPIRPATAQKLLGKNVLVFLNYGEDATEALPVWSLIGGQRSAGFTNSADEIDLSDKNSGGYGETDQGIKNTDIEMEILIIPGDEAVQQIYDAYEKGEAVDILRWSKEGRSSRNWYSITETSEEAAHDDAATMSLSLKGMGQPIYIDDMPDPRE